MKRFATPATWWAVLGGALTFAACVWRGFSLDRIEFAGDQALLLQSARDILHLQWPLVGAYSKGDLHHPGPLYQCLLAVVSLVTGGSVRAVSLGLAAVQSSVVTFGMLIAWRTARSYAAMAAVPLLVIFGYWFFFMLQVIWNPAIVWPCLLASGWLVLEARRGAVWALPCLAVVVSLMVQSHMSAALPGAVLAGAGVLATWRAPRQDTRAVRRSLVWTIAASAVVWAPPVVDVIRHDGGNLRRLWAFLAQADASHTWGEASAAFHDLGSRTLPPLLGVPATSWVDVALAGAAVAVVVGWRRSAPLLWSAALGVSLTAAWFVSVLRVPGPWEEYYLSYATLLVAWLLVATAGAVAEVLPPRPFRGALREVPGLILVIALVVQLPLWGNPTWAQYTAPWGQYPYGAQLDVARAIRADAGGRPVRFDMYGADLDPVRPSLRFALGEADVPFEESDAAPFYRVISTPTFVEMGDRPVDGGRVLLRNARYVLEYVATR